MENKRVTTHSEISTLQWNKINTSYQKSLSYEYLQQSLGGRKGTHTKDKWQSVWVFFGLWSIYHAADCTASESCNKRMHHLLWIPVALPNMAKHFQMGLLETGLKHKYLEETDYGISLNLPMWMTINKIRKENTQGYPSSVEPKIGNVFPTWWIFFCPNFTFFVFPPFVMMMRTLVACRYHYWLTMRRAVMLLHFMYHFLCILSWVLNPIVKAQSFSGFMIIQGTNFFSTKCIIKLI